MFHKHFRFFILLSVLFTCFFASQVIAVDEKYVIVDVEGVGSDRSSAIENAWFEGIRQAVGSFIDAKTELNNDQLAERIIAYSIGIVERYEITGVDDSRASEGLYKLKMRLWIVRELLRDGANHVSSGGFEVAFSPADLKKREELNLREIEARDSASETSMKKSQTGAELLEAMLNRYKPEDFLTCYIPGKPEAVQDMPDSYTLKVEVNFNEKLYNEAFIPDLIQVLDQIASVKKNTTLIKYRAELRDIASRKGTTSDTSSIIAKALKGEDGYLLAVYNRPERFGVRFYGFNDEDASEIIGVLSQFKERTRYVTGVLLELLDENKEVIESVEEKFRMDFLISASGYGDVWTIHPTILYEDYENKVLEGMITFEMPDEVIPFVKSLKTSLLIGEPCRLPQQKIGWLGALIMYDNGDNAYISYVYPDSPAEKAGLMVNDVISDVNGQDVNGTQGAMELVRIIRKFREDDIVRLKIIRNVRSLSFNIRLGMIH